MLNATYIKSCLLIKNFLLYILLLVAVAGGQPEFALSENKAYSLQPSPTYDYYDDINCVNPTYENGEENEYINMKPAKGTHIYMYKSTSNIYLRYYLVIIHT